MATRTPAPHPTQAPRYTPPPVAPPLADVARPVDSRAASLRLGAYTLLILFFELAFIRYTAGEVRVFGFYLNFVVIAAFLGMGTGLLRAAAAERVKWLAVPASVLVIAGVVYLSRTHVVVPSRPTEHLWSVFLDGGAGRRPVPGVAAAMLARREGDQTLA